MGLFRVRIKWKEIQLLRERAETTEPVRVAVLKKVFPQNTWKLKRPMAFKQ